MPAFDCHQADIVIEVGPRGEGVGLFENRFEELVGWQTGVAGEGREQSLPSEFLPLRREDFKDSIRVDDDAITLFERRP